MSLQLAARGFRVVLTSRADRGEAAARRLAGVGLAVEHRPLDVTDPGSVAALGTALAGTPLDVLVNNAGISMQGFDAAVARGTLEVNFFGALRVTETLLPLVPDGGTIVMVSSGMGEPALLAPALRERFTDPASRGTELCEFMRSFVRDVEAGRHAERGWPSSAYRVSKIGPQRARPILAPAPAPRRIRVNAACPGWVRTDMGPGRQPRRRERAASIVWAATPRMAPRGGFFRDGRAISAAVPGTDFVSKLLAEVGYAWRVAHPHVERPADLDDGLSPLAAVHARAGGDARGGGRRSAGDLASRGAADRERAAGDLAFAGGRPGDADPGDDGRDRSDAGRDGSDAGDAGCDGSDAGRDGSDAGRDGRDGSDAGRDGSDTGHDGRDGSDAGDDGRDGSDVRPGC